MEKPVKPEDTARKGGLKRRKRCQENKKLWKNRNKL